MPRKSSMPLSSNPNSKPKPKPKPFLPEVTNTPAAQKPGFFSAVKDGLGLGFGSAIAHRVVGSVLGSSQYTQVQPQVQVQALEKKNTEYDQCMKDYNNRDVCEIYLGK